MTSWTHLPIRLRLTLAFGAGLVLVLGVLSTFVYMRTGADLMTATEAGLRSRAEVIAADVASHGPTLANVQPTLTESDEAFAQVADASGSIVQSSPILSGHPLLSSDALRSVSRPAFFDRSLRGIDGVTRLLAVPVESGGRRYAIIVGASLQDRRDEMVQLAATLAIAGPIALLVILAGAWLLAGAALRPVERMRRKASSISTSEPGRRLPVSGGNDEIALLGVTLNEMLDRIQDSVARERRLVDRASHELRTPLAIQRMAVDLALSGPGKTEELLAALRSVSEENDHLERLAEDLLVLSRAQGGRLTVHPVKTSVSVLLEEARCRNETRARAAGIELRVAAPAFAVRVDPAWVRQALDNLINNALRYTPRGGSVEVSAERHDGTVRVLVEDSGPGFPEAFLAHAFEPFARARPGAEREGGGTGLGLAIVRSIAEAMGGTAEAENRASGGARLTLTLSDREVKVGDSL